MTRLVATLALTVAYASIVRAQQPVCDSRIPSLLGAQMTAIPQRLEPFHSPYAGPLSLRPDGDRQMSESYGVYTGVCAGWGLEAYVDAEMIRGAGISHASGLAGVTNGDVIRQGSVDLGDGPYVARAFLRWTRTLASSATDTIARAMDARAEIVSARRIEVTAGRFAATDLFDLNRYANSTRTQFLNWVLFQNGAWDYAADTRGYSNGVAVSWIDASWTLRAGSFQMPTEANGNRFDAEIARARGDNLELTLAAPGNAVVRMLAYVNQARMGRYAVVIADAAAHGTAPNIVADDAPGRTKYGFGFNAEVPIADRGETGAFARLGLDDGRTESFAFTEADRHASGGLQIAGNHWGRPTDRLGIAVAADGLSVPHRAYLVAGGCGFLLCDGALRYGWETIDELYYRAQLGAYVELSPDVQFIANPGYNRDRGPATVLTLRAEAHY